MEWGITPYQEAAPLLALLATPGLGRRHLHRLRRLAHRSDHPLESFLAGTPRASGMIPADWCALLAEAKTNLPQAQALVHRLKAAGIHILCPSCDAYPLRLLEALEEDSPAVLFVRGELEHLQAPALALVGTVSPSRVGVEVVSKCVRFLATLPHVSGNPRPAVVSGGARGIDTAAHRSALEEGGSTVVVLPQGLLTYEIPHFLKRGLRDGMAALVSEFPPDAPWETHAAVTRNATISALAKVVCVVEPRRLGGSVQTARAAMAQGKPVFAYCPPGANQIADILRQAGIRSLLTEDGALKVHRIQEAWSSGRLPVRTQQWLF